MRKRTKAYPVLIYFALFLFYTFALPDTGAASDDTAYSETVSYEKLYNELLNLPENKPAEVAEVHNISIKRDVARFDLLDGKLYLLPPITGRWAVAVFKGNGKFHFAPPIKAEEQQLFRYYKKTSLHEEFNFLFLLFTDTTFVELDKKLKFENGGSEFLRLDLQSVLGYLSDKDSRYFDTDIMNTLLNPAQAGYFYAHIFKDKLHPWFFEISPFQVEEIRLLRKPAHILAGKFPEVICQFHKQQDFKAGVYPGREQKDVLRIRHYAIETSIDGNLELDFSAVADLQLRFLKSGLRWVPFRLFSALEVDSVIWDDGSPAVFSRGKGNPMLWVQMDSLLKENDIRNLKVCYHGDLFEQGFKGKIYTRSAAEWYPYYRGGVPATFDLVYHFPERLPTLVSVGEKISEEQDGGTITSHWSASKPVYSATFNVARFETFTIRDDRIPDVDVLAYPGSRVTKDVIADIANSLMLYHDLFGNYPVKKFYAVETPMNMGVAFPGLIQLGLSTFHSTDKHGTDELFRAHEVAHQWWGIEVECATYHDWWLTEGLCNFAGLRYMQMILYKQGGTEKYFEMLRDWRDQIMTNRKYLFGDGREAGPIWLGYRTRSSETRGDYSLIIYEKGAWVFHMLRNMMLNVNDFSDESRFTDMMHDFYRSYRGRKVSSLDFRKVVEKYVGMDMGWFFDQWIYGTDIPQYKFAYKIDTTGEGKYLIRVRVAQSDVSLNFKMPVLINIDFGDNESYTIRKMITGPEMEFNLIVVPFKPKKVVFNYLESVLCEVKNVDWDEWLY